jgi:Domain of unknown function (DUF4351)/Putative transposase, YhgA-like
MIDHDELFKKLLTTFFIEFIELFLPSVAAYFDRDAIAFLPQEYFTDTTTGDRRKIDVLAQVKFREQDTCFLIHLENQSYNQDDFDRRMFFYFARLYQKYLLPIYPIAVFSFEYPLRPQRQQHQVMFPDFKVLDFNFAVIQLNQLNWRDFLQQRNPVAAALMAKMRIARADRPRVKAECLRILATLELDPARIELISGFVDTYLRLNATEETIFQAEIDKMGLGEQEQIMEIVTSWMERGIEQGREREVALVLRQLTRRLNGLSVSLEERVHRLSIEQVEALGEALLDFSSETDLVHWLAQIE